MTTARARREAKHEAEHMTLFAARMARLVVDGGISLILNVTRDDIAIAKPGSKQFCVFAVTACRQLGLHPLDVSIGMLMSFFCYSDGNGGWIWIRHMTPRNMRPRLIVFDRHGARIIPPGEYIFLPPMGRDTLVEVQARMNKIEPNSYPLTRAADLRLHASNGEHKTQHGVSAGVISGSGRWWRN